MSLPQPPEPSKKSARPPSRAAQDVPVSYRTLFWVCITFTFMTFLASFYLATKPTADQTEGLKVFVASCDTVWKMGIGGVFGLVFGKGTRR